MMLRNKKILVTGADGFIGSHLVESLVKTGANVRALSFYNSFNSWGWLEDIECLDDVEVVSGDIRDSHYCENIAKGVDVIFHLASLVAIPYSYRAPDSYVDTNINGTVNICHAALKNGCERIIHTSSSEVYGTARYVPMNEEHPLQPQSPYSATKIGADAMAMSFYNTYNLPLTIARPFNTYGPRQSARAIIPTIIIQIANGKKNIRLGSALPRRDFNYVEDICAGMISLAGCNKALGQAINIGTNDDISIRGLFDLIKEIMGSTAKYKEESERIRPKRSEVFRLRCDDAKIRKLTGFKPKYVLREGLIKTIKWFTNPNNLKRYKEGIYNV